MPKNFVAITVISSLSYNFKEFNVNIEVTQINMYMNVIIYNQMQYIY